MDRYPSYSLRLDADLRAEMKATKKCEKLCSLISCPRRVPVDIISVILMISYVCIPCEIKKRLCGIRRASRKREGEGQAKRQISHNSQ